MLGAGEATTFSSSMRYIIIFVLQQQDYCGTEDRYIIIFVLQQQDYCGTEDRYSKLKNVNVFNLVLFYVYSYPTFVLSHVCTCPTFFLLLCLSLF